MDYQEFLKKTKDENEEELEKSILAVHLDGFDKGSQGTIKLVIKTFEKVLEEGQEALTTKDVLILLRRLEGVIIEKAEGE